MKIKIFSLKGIEFEGEAKSFNVKTKVGEITVMDNHRPLITSLVKGVAKIGLAGEEIKEIEINSGFLEMDDNNNLSVLAE
ncbi:hypothetical protein HYT00_02900 [Candidatus Giovannonibacteria bacterium]|nr:hypothetical protein [Candidatus Giovannonibacteria bacterium]